VDDYQVEEDITDISCKGEDVKQHVTHRKEGMKGFLGRSLPS